MHHATWIGTRLCLRQWHSSITACGVLTVLSLLPFGATQVLGIHVEPHVKGAVLARIKEVQQKLGERCRG